MICNITSNLTGRDVNPQNVPLCIHFDGKPKEDPNIPSTDHVEERRITIHVIFLTEDIILL